MRLRKLNLSFTGKFLLLLSFIYSPKLFGQTHTVSVAIRNGKIEYSPRDSTARFIISNRTPGNQRPFTINSISITITTTGSTCGGNNGSLIAVATGGTAPYSFALSNGWVFQTGNFPRLPAGNYTVTVTDAAGLTATASAAITNTFSPPLYSTPSFQPTSGCAAQDGSVTLFANGGTLPYQYSMDGVNYQSSNVFSNLYAGFYTFFVKDANGCTIAYDAFFMNYLISPSCDVSLGVTFTDRVCGNEGFIQGTVFGPNGPFLYSLDGINYQSVFSFPNLVAGTYYLHIKYANGAIAILAFVFRPGCDIRIDYITVDAACQQNDGILTATASLGTAPYTYTLDGVNYQSSNVFTGLSPGNYFITVRDANGFTSSLAAVLYDRCPAVSLTATAETCLLHNGTITATAIKGTPPYQYSMDGVNFQNSNVFTGLATGTYTITLRDALGFTTTGTIAVPYSCVIVTATTVNSTCGNSNGSITASASNGTAPYQYSLDGVNFQSSNTFSGLAAATYTVTARDIAGKTGTATVIVLNTPGPQISVTTNPASCNNDGVITITGTGGTPPFQFSINGTNFLTGNIFNNVTAGNYTAWIKDVNGCLASQSVTVSLSCPIVTASATNETCSNSNGTITAIASGGTPPYQFSIDGTNFQTSNIFSGHSAGAYTVTVKDATGVTNTTTVIINNICPTVTVTVTNGLCGTANGSIIATGANGTQPYQYSIDGINFQTSNTFSGLASGTYTITVKDVNGLTNTTISNVQNFPGPLISVTSTTTSCLNNNGSINITATGGTSPLQYSITGTNFQNSNVFNSLAGGNYTAIIKDANGCLATQQVFVTLADNLTINRGSDISICEGTSTTFMAVSNGASFNWSPAVGLSNANQINPTASPMITTRYYITATLGICSKTDSLIVFVNPAPIAYAGKDSTICYGQSIQLNGSGGLIYNWTPATYLSDTHVSNPVVTNPTRSITYSLFVTDANGCRSLQSSSTTVTVTPPAKIFAGNDTSIVMNQPFVLTAIDINNSGFVQYNWSPSYGLNNSAIQTPVTILDRNMTYTVTAITQSGCQGSDEINIKVYKGPEIYVPNAFSPNNDGKNDVLKAIPVGIKEFKYFIIYNRWGQRIFYSRNPSNGWDGKNKGFSIDAGTYVWTAEGTDEKGNVISRKGTVTLIR